METIIVSWTNTCYINGNQRRLLNTFRGCSKDFAWSLLDKHSWELVVYTIWKFFISWKMYFCHQLLRNCSKLGKNVWLSTAKAIVFHNALKNCQQNPNVPQNIFISVSRFSSWWSRIVTSVFCVQTFTPRIVLQRNWRDDHCRMDLNQNLSKRKRRWICCLEFHFGDHEQEKWIVWLCNFLLPVF